MVSESIHVSKSDTIVFFVFAPTLLNPKAPPLALILLTKLFSKPPITFGSQNTKSLKTSLRGDVTPFRLVLWFKAIQD